MATGTLPVCITALDQEAATTVCSEEKVDVLITEDWRMTVRKIVGQHGNGRSAMQEMMCYTRKFYCWVPWHDEWAQKGTCDIAIASVTSYLTLWLVMEASSTILTPKEEARTMYKLEKKNGKIFLSYQEVHNGWFPAQKRSCQCNSLHRDAPATATYTLWHVHNERTHHSSTQEYTLSHYQHIWCWRRLKSLAGRCFPILPSVWTWPLPTATFSSYQKITWEASTMKTLRQSSRLCVHGCKIVKQTSTAVAYSSSYNAGRNSWIILEILWNSDKTSLVIQGSICFCTCTFALI